MIDVELVAEIAEFAIELYDENRNMPQATAVRRTVEKFAGQTNSAEQPIQQEMLSEKAESTPDIQHEPDREATDPEWNKDYRKSAHEELAGRYESILGPELFDRRAEQDLQWGGPIHDDTHTHAEWLTGIFLFVDKARRVCTDTHPERYEDKLFDVAALAISAIKSSRRKRNA